MLGDQQTNPSNPRNRCESPSKPCSFDDVRDRNQHRMERFLRGGSLGRSLAKYLGEGLTDLFDKPSKTEMQIQQETDDGSRVGLRSLNYLKKFYAWKIPQGSITRVLSFRQNRQFSFSNYKSYIRPVQSPTLSEYGSIVSSYSYRASSPPELGRPATSASVNVDSDTQMKSFLTKRKRRHRRAKSIGDITVTPV